MNYDVTTSRFSYLGEHDSSSPLSHIVENTNEGGVEKIEVTGRGSSLVSDIEGSILDFLEEATARYEIEIETDATTTTRARSFLLSKRRYASVIWVFQEDSICAPTS